MGLASSPGRSSVFEDTAGGHITQPPPDGFILETPGASCTPQAFDLSPTRRPAGTQHTTSLSSWSRFLLGSAVGRLEVEPGEHCSSRGLSLPRGGGVCGATRRRMVRAGGRGAGCRRDTHAPALPTEDLFRHVAEAPKYKCRRECSDQHGLDPGPSDLGRQGRGSPGRNSAGSSNRI